MLGNTAHEHNARHSTAANESQILFQRHVLSCMRCTICTRKASGNNQITVRSLAKCKPCVIGQAIASSRSAPATKERFSRRSQKRILGRASAHIDIIIIMSIFSSIIRFPARSSGGFRAAHACVRTTAACLAYCCRRRSW